MVVGGGEELSEFTDAVSLGRSTQLADLEVHDCNGFRFNFAGIFLPHDVEEEAVDELVLLGVGLQDVGQCSQHVLFVLVGHFRHGLLDACEEGL